jgi:DNA-binding CsgD family transcriptional regulator
MTFKFSFIAIFLIVLVNQSLKPQSSVEGQLIIDTTIWTPIVYLSYIPDFDNLNSMSNDMIIDQAEIDANGRFYFNTEYFPKEDNMFRIHITKKNDPPASLILGGKDENFVFLIANNRTQIVIKNTSDQELMKNVSIVGYYPDLIINQINKIANFLDTIPLTGSRAKNELIKNSIFSSLRTIADTCSNPLISLYALYRSNLENNLIVNQQFYKNFLSKWKQDKSTYFTAFRRKLSPSNETKLWGYILIIVFSIIIGILLTLNGLKLFRKNNNLTNSLSVQERKIFVLIKDGKSNKEISDILNIGLNTVKSHVSSIYSKLKIGSRKEVLNLNLDDQEKTYQDRSLD